MKRRTKPKRLAWTKGPYTMDHVVTWLKRRAQTRTPKGCWPGWNKLFIAAQIAKNKLDSLP